MKPSLGVLAFVVAAGLMVPAPAHAQLGAARRAAQRVATSGSQRKLPDDSGNVPQQYQGVPATPRVPVAPAVVVPAAPAKAVDAAKVASDKEAAVARLVALQKEQAEKGRPGAQYELGMRYLKGDGVPQDAKLGREWIQKSAKQGESEAVRKLKELDAAEAAAAKVAVKPVVTPPPTLPLPVAPPSK